MPIIIISIELSISRVVIPRGVGDSRARLATSAAMWLCVSGPRAMLPALLYSTRLRHCIMFI